MWAPQSHPLPLLPPGPVISLRSQLAGALVPAEGGATFVLSGSLPRAHVVIGVTPE